MEINKEYLELAKQQIGKKAILLGGGQFANAFIIVDVLDVDMVKGQAKVDEGNNIFNPYMSSYHIIPISDVLKDLGLGSYIITGNEIRKQDGGVFGTIYDCTLVKTLGKNNKSVMGYNNNEEKL
ncbi:hypothetical protein LCGC14_0225390 [marine sediment metagenome]|uniref:Uncharacterized protein n=1 Tax=marine sediment metagenome TaxID=412755 RepID=A0A0F9UCQ0_9ZZZZ